MTRCSPCVVTARWRSARRASPRSISAASAHREVVGDRLVVEQADDDGVARRWRARPSVVAMTSTRGATLPARALRTIEVRPPTPEPPEHAQDRHPLRRPNADRQARRRPGQRRRHRARRHRDPGRARARRRRARAGRARDHGPGAPGRPGPDSLPPGADQGRHPQGGLLGDDQQGLRLGHPGRRHARRGDPRRRHRGRGRRGHGVDVERAVPAQGGPLRLPHGRRQGDRRDDQRRAHQPVQRQAHGPRGERGRRRARDDSGGHGSLGAALARAGDQGHRRGPAARGDRAGDGQGPQGRHGRRDRRGAAAGHDARDAGQAAARSS